MKTSYKYQELKSRSHIRLLKLCPDVSSAKKTQKSSRTDDGTEKKFIFDLITTDLDHAPSYETVSYAWGTGSQKENISIGKGGRLAIARLLSDALPQLASAAETEYLWIDQICIDQKNIEEKNHQVRIMGDIYKRCQRVMIYIAPNLFPVGLQRPVWKPADRYYSYDGGRVTFKHVVTEIVHLQDDLFHRRSCDPNLSCADFSKWATQTWPTFGPEPSALALLYLIYRHPWFLRGWVFQEVVLAPRTRILACDFEIDPRFLLWASRQIENLEKQALGSLPQTMSLLGSSEGYTRFQSMMQYTSRDPLDVLDTISSRSNFSIGHDHVYGFLGIMDRQFISPDYSLPMHEVFIRAAANIIDHDGTLRLFGYLNRMKGQSRNALGVDPRSGGLPSWVPCWADRRATERLSAPSSDYKTFATCKKRKHTLPASENLPYLNVRGGQIGTVDKVINGDRIANIDALLEILSAAENQVDGTEDSKSSLTKRSGSHNAKLRAKLKLHSLLHKLKPSHGKIGSQKLPSNTFDRLIHIVAQSQDPTTSCKQSVHTSASKFPHLRQVLSSATDHKNNHDLANELDALEKFVNQQTLFVTDHGSIGCAAARTAITKGDTVCILHGLQTPIILRERGTQSKPREVCTIIDLCYLENSMRGEAVIWAEEEAEEFLLH